MLEWARYDEASLRLHELDVLGIKINRSPQWDISVHNARYTLRSYASPPLCDRTCHRVVVPSCPSLCPSQCPSQCPSHHQLFLFLCQHKLWSTQVYSINCSFLVYQASIETYLWSRLILQILNLFVFEHSSHVCALEVSKSRFEWYDVRCDPNILDIC